MDIFKRANKMNISSIIFSVLTLVLGWMITEIANPVLQLQIGETALVFLTMFFFSMNSEKINELEKKLKLLALGNRKPKEKLVP